MNVLLLTAHSIAEYDDVRMLTGLGYDVFSIGAYTDPAHPTDDKRPPLPEPDGVRWPRTDWYHPELAAACQRQRERHAGDPLDFAIDWAKADLAPEVLDWADVTIVHHFPIPWILAQWPRLRGKRVIWRTCGQSDPELERLMAPLHRQGLQIVRYSPAERRAFGRIGAFAGEDAMIRFGKEPSDWYGTPQREPLVGNITQDMVGRGDACGLRFWLAATEGLPVAPAGPGSERLRGGLGSLSYDEMRAYLKRIGVYLYTGTRAASYTLGLIEAMLSGVPVVSIGARAFLPQLPELFEAPELTGLVMDEPEPSILRRLLDDPDEARRWTVEQYNRALYLFSGVGLQWRAFLDRGEAIAASTLATSPRAWSAVTGLAE
ncbi:MAG TPA: hypothetical protein VFW86_05780 [Candidatus Limnocylindrales bacterium]|nr:hypothetical protein [Candidatus Limnocylindrales bacterium]